MKLQHINKIYHNKNNDVLALDDLSLEIHDCGMIFIMGPSGSGKSTLSRIMCNLDHDYSGTCQNDGKVEYVEQDICLFENMTVIDNLKLVSNNDSSEYLHMFKMKEFQNQLVKTLSIGQKKRVQIIRSLLTHYDYLILDEPTASLDQENTDIIMDVLQKISQDHIVIIITHETILNERYADRSILLDKGKIVEDTIHHTTHPLKPQNHPPVHKNNITFQFKRIRHSLLLHSIKLVVIMMMTASLLVLSSFLISIEGNIEARNAWLDSKNAIVTQPHDSQTMIGDLYDHRDIQKIKDNVDGIIGYQIGWSAPHISYAETIAPAMTIDDVKAAIEQEEKEGKPYSDDYNHFKDILDEAIRYEETTGKQFPSDLELANNLSAYEGFSKNQDGTYKVPLIQTRFGFFENEVAVYQLFDMNSLDLKYGHIPKNDDEIIIDVSTAKNLCKEYNITSMENLIDQKYNIILKDNSSKKMTVSGITYQESQHESRIYFAAGNYDKLLSQQFEFHDDKLQYVYLSFLSDASTNIKAATTQINQIIKGKNSSFIAYPDSVLNTMSNTTSSYSTLSYTIAGLIVLTIMIIYILVLWINRKSYNKEIKILKHYHQSVLIYITLPVVLFTIINTLVFTLTLTSICQMVNTYANTLGYNELIQNNVLILIISLLAAFIVNLLLEGGFYAYQTRKHS